MIAAGSLFTSCIEPIEPAGIYDLREAKARYYDALSKLRAADAMLVEAQAAHETQRAEFQKKMVENQELLNQAQKLANEAQALGNEQEAFRWEQEKERLETERELLRYQWEQQFLQAQLDLREATARFQMAMLDLTDAEKAALADAIARYEAALQNYLVAEENVVLAEANLWDAMYAYENMMDEEGIYYNYLGDYINTGEDLIEYYESCIEMEEIYIAYYAALYEYFENNTELAEWAEELTALKDELAELLYSRHEVTVDSVYFMEGVFHEANIAMGIAVDKWIADNEGVKDPGAAPVKPTEAQFPASKYQKDSIAFDVLEYTAPNQAFDKFRSLISSYETVKSLVKDTTYNTITVNTTDKKITLIANQQMKDFVLGTETSTKGSQVLKYYDKETKKNVEVKADYGLVGALSVLKRDLVLKGKEGKTPEELAKELKEAKENWEADRDTLVKFYKAVVAAKDDPKVDPYQAYQPIADATKALDQAKADAKSDAGSLVKASQTLVETINGIINHDDISTADSTKLVDAIVDFAKAREAYLDYTPYQNGVDYDNKDLFYKAFSTSPDILVDSIDFSKITLAEIRKNKSYEYKTDGSHVTTAKVAAFENIASQLFGATIAKAISTMGAGNPNYPIKETDLNYDGFYDAYQYVAGDPAVIKTKAGDDYTPKAVTDAEAALAKAVVVFNDCFERFWAVNPAADGKNFTQFAEGGAYEKYNPECYMLSTFTEPYNCVAFDEDGETIMPTAALQVVLASVDPKATTDFQGKNFDPIKTTSAIFWNNKTDFYKYMKAAWAADNTDTQAAIEKIEKWIEGVKAAFAKNVSDAEAAAKKAYDDAVDAYEKAVPTYEANKAKYDAYYAKLKAFVGTKTVDGKEVLLNVKTVDGVQVPSLKELPKPADYQTPYVAQTQVEPFVWTGEWNKKMIGGEQLELANKLFVDDEGNTYPELLAAWRSKAKWINDQINHYEKAIAVIEKAYMSAIGTIEDATGEEMLIDYGSEENYLADILDSINFYMELEMAYLTMYTEILEKAKAGYDPAQLQIMQLEDKLAIAQQKLEDAAVKLQVAEDYYNKVLNAILGAN